MAGLKEQKKWMGASLLLLSVVAIVAYKTDGFKEFSHLRAGYLAVDDSEGKDLKPYQKPGTCRAHYPWGAPQTNDPEVTKRALYLCNGTFSLQFDTINKVPLWTSEVLLKTALVEMLKRKLPVEGTLEPDPRFPIKAQADPTSFFNNDKYAMGFMTSPYNAYTNTFSTSTDPKQREQYKQINKQNVQDTFYMTNVVPMHKHLKAGLWNDLDKEIRTQAIVNHLDRLYVTSGPLYLGGKNLGEFGVTGVKIPTHFFRIVTNPGYYSSVAYIIPNKEIATHNGQVFQDPNDVYYCGSKEHPQLCGLNDFIVPITEVERLTGLYIYPNLAPHYSIKVKQNVEEYLKKKGLID